MERLVLNRRKRVVGKGGLNFLQNVLIQFLMKITIFVQRMKINRVAEN